MATNKWLGHAEDIAQVDLITIALTWATADTVTLTISDKQLIATIGSDSTIEDVVDIIIAMVNGAALDNDETRTNTGNLVGEFEGITATKSGTTIVIMTADTAGVPFTLTVASTTAGSGTSVRSASVANSSKNDFGNVDNWSAGSVPVAGDDVFFQNSDVDVLYNLDRSAVAHQTMRIEQSFTGKIGAPVINPGLSIPYSEYRSTELETASPDIVIGQGGGDGSGRIKLNSGSTASITIEVVNTGSAEESDKGSFLWRGTGATNTMILREGSVGLGIFAAETANLNALTILEAEVTHITGTLTTVNMNGSGTLLSEGTVTTLNVNSNSEVTLNGATSTTVTVKKGTVIDNSSGTLATGNVHSEGTLDYTNNPFTARTITNKMNLYPGSTLNDPNGILTLTNGFTIPGVEVLTLAAPSLILDSTAQMTLQIGAVDILAIDDTAIASFAAATDAAGQGIFIETEDGGVDGGAASTGQAGGAFDLKTGDGSAAATTNAVGGAGGAMTLTTGTGLAGDGTGNGGVGGAMGIVAAAGGASGAGAGVGGTGGSVTLTAGAGGAVGGGTVGAPGSVDITAGILTHTAPQTIDMADAALTLTLVPGTPTGTLMTSNILYVDPNSGTTENLLLPPEADLNGAVLLIVNTGGETVNIQNDAGGAVLTLETANTAIVTSDGTTLRGAVLVP